MSLERRLLGLWYGPAWRTAVLWPLELIYRGAVGLRGLAYRSGLLARQQAGAPVVIVGNLTVGGTGKTPVTSWLASELRTRGLECGIVLRGYGGRHAGAPLRVTEDSDPEVAGDEAVLHARRGAGIVVVGRDRVAAARAAVAAGAQVVICDDGLQHLRLARQFEIAVVDAARGLGNGHLLPAGPLREPAARIAGVDAVVVTDRGQVEERVVAAVGQGAYRARLRPGAAVNLRDGTRRSLDEFRGQRLHAVAAIGHPEAFFAALRAAGLSIEAHAWPDHGAIEEGRLAAYGDSTVLMTEKDAVKCRGIARPGWWYADLEVTFEPAVSGERLVAAVLAALRSDMKPGGRLG